MSTSTIAALKWNGLQLPASRCPDQRERILTALGGTAASAVRVDHDTLTHYYAYLSANLVLPLMAYYPQPRNTQEQAQFLCTVVKLLDPTRYVGDEFDGIFCKTRKWDFEVNLPLVELQAPHDSPSFQLIEDYGHWFWNWR